MYDVPADLRSRANCLDSTKEAEKAINTRHKALYMVNFSNELA
jgi:hypothetical protein